jgi:hypothetical protein
MRRISPTVFQKFPFLGGGMDVVYLFFGVFINGWRFTDGYITAIRWLACFRLAIYTLSYKKPGR